MLKACMHLWCICTIAASTLRVYQKEHIKPHIILRFGKSLRMERHLALDSEDVTEVELWGNPSSWLPTNDLQLLDNGITHPRCPRENEHAYLLYSTTLAKELFVCGGGAVRSYGLHGAFPIGMRSSTTTLVSMIEIGRQHITLGSCASATSKSLTTPCDSSQHSRAGGLCLTNITLQTKQTKHTSRMHVYSTNPRAMLEDTTYHALLRNTTTSHTWIELFHGTRISLTEFIQTSATTKRNIFDVRLKKVTDDASLGNALLNHFEFCMNYDQESMTLTLNTLKHDVNVHTCVLISIILLLLFATNNNKNDNVIKTMLQLVYHGICVGMVTKKSFAYQSWMAVAPIVHIVLSAFSVISLLPTQSTHPYKVFVQKLIFNMHCVGAIYCTLSEFDGSITLCIVNTIVFCFGCYNGYFMLSRTFADAIFESSITPTHAWAFASSITIGVQLYVYWISIDEQIHMFLLQQDTPFDSLSMLMLILLIISENSTSSRLVKTKHGLIQLHTNSHVTATHALKSMRNTAENHTKNVELSGINALLLQNTNDTSILPVSSAKKQVTRRRVYPKAHTITRPLH